MLTTYYTSVFLLKLILQYENFQCNFKAIVNLNFNNCKINWVELYYLLNNSQFLFFYDYKKCSNKYLGSFNHVSKKTLGTRYVSTEYRLCCSNEQPQNLCAYDSGGLFLVHAICLLQKWNKVLQKFSSLQFSSTNIC